MDGRYTNKKRGWSKWKTAATIGAGLAAGSMLLLPLAAEVRRDLDTRVGSFDERLARYRLKEAGFGKDEHYSYKKELSPDKTHYQTIKKGPDAPSKYIF